MSSNLIFSYCVFISITSASSEVYTAIAHLEKLYKTEALLIEGLEKYIKGQEALVGELKKYVEQYKTQKIQRKTFLPNPLSAFMLIKRLTLDWQIVRRIGRDNELILYDIENNIDFPDEEDLSGAALAVARLQITYNLRTLPLANGEIYGIQYSEKLASADCFEIAIQLYLHQKYYHALFWLHASETKFVDGQERINKIEILELRASTFARLGNISLALKTINDLLALHPKHPRALNDKELYEFQLMQLNISDVANDQIPQLDFIENLETDWINNSRSLYTALCRGEVPLALNVSSSLKCYFLDNDLFYLKIGPFKVEEVLVDPKILVFHDVIYDSEIKVIKDISEPRLQRAAIGKLLHSQRRISKATFLLNFEDKVIERVERRVGHMTLLQMRTSEPLQVVNYGIGGQYEPHFDCTLKQDVEIFGHLGNRMATVLFYMSDVEAGGATVFPNIKLSVFPKKGTAVVWYNLLTDGEGDLRSFHAACPVLIGSKWVCNKWIHESEQEFIKPCELKPAPRELVMN